MVLHTVNMHLENISLRKKQIFTGLPCIFKEFLRKIEVLCQSFLKSENVL